MRIPAGTAYVCTFPDYDDDPVKRVEIEARSSQQAAVKATGLWEERLDDFRVLRGEDTLRIRIEGKEGGSDWEVLGVQGRYVAKERKPE